MNRFLKRLMEVFICGAALPLLAPVMAVIALVIWLTMGRPVLFRHVRPGYKARPFVLYKFRTMNYLRDAQARPLSDAERLTSQGKLLRRLSLDELPQLWNVLRGDMSLVGPRPLLMNYLERYSPEQARRHEVKPGITGWAQVNGRNALSWEERFRFDIWYVDHWSLGLDVKIIWKTIQKVFQREGISLDGHATMPEFTGGKDLGL
jgi:lipopolysaccharide/colanic/teichoic acid biosynthesis glycosyltransferase